MEEAWNAKIANAAWEWRSSKNLDIQACFLCLLPEIFK
jgi:hypothetical protein